MIQQSMNSLSKQQSNAASVLEGQGWRLVSQTKSLSVGLTTNGWNTVPGTLTAATA